jgi:PEP-CTERM/exosortase A-associated glycosyltransferase
VRALWEDAAVNHGTSTEWGLRYRLARALETWVLRRADALTTICEGLRTEIASRTVPRLDATVVPNAVDAKRFAPVGPPDAGLARELGMEGQRVIGFAGSFYAYEGLDLLLRALPLVRAQEPRAKVLLVGSGPQEAELRRLAAGIGVSDHVVFVGRVPHPDVPRYYGLIDLLVYPRISIRLTEMVTPLKPLEALAQGKLVIASDVGGHRELLGQGELCELFRAGDVGDLAATILRLFSRPEERVRRTAAARKHIERERTWAASVGKYQAVYQSVCAARR